MDRAGRARIQVSSRSGRLLSGMRALLPTGFELVSRLHGSPSSEVSLVVRGGEQVVAKVPVSRDPARRAQLRWEYEALSRLDSPLIIRSLEFVEEPFTCALVLPWDRDLRPLAEFAPMSLERWLAVALKMATAIVEVHGAAIVHKDIKPANFLASQDLSKLLLIDFDHCSGLATERESTVDAAALKGSLSYIAPEQTGRMSRGTDFRADFYALGISLYELMSGAPPFRAETPAELVHAHIAKNPPPLTSPLFNVPAVIEGIVSRLLAKSPDDRYQSAKGLCADLKRCIETREGLAIAPFELGEQDDRYWFRIPDELFGRESQLAQVATAYGSASAGRRQIVFAAGPSGIGKSRLVAETRRSLPAKGGIFAAGKADQHDRNHPFAAVVDAIGSWVDSISGADDEIVESWRQRLRASVGTHGRLLTELIPNMTWLLGEQAGVPEGDADQTQSQMIAALIGLLSGLCAPNEPLILFVDDLQWADSPTFALLREIGREQPKLPMLVLGSFRDNEVGEAHPLAKVLRDLQDAPGVSTIALGPLSRADVGGLVAATLPGRRQHEALADFVHERSGGNPFFATQLLTTLHSTQALRFEVGSHEWAWDEPQARSLPAHDGVVGLLLANFARLPEACREVLSIAACLGTRFDLGTLAAACEPSAVSIPLSEFGSFAAAVGDALWPALSGGFLVPHQGDYRRARDPELDLESASLVTLGFAHDRIREAAQRLLGEREPEVRSALGRRLLATLDADELDLRLLEVVDHLNWGKAPTDRDHARKFAELNLRAARRARSGVAPDAASSYCRGGLRMLGQEAWQDAPEISFELTILGADCEYLVGHPQAAAVLLERAYASGPSPRQRARALQIEGVALGRTRACDEALAKLVEALGCLGVSFPYPVSKGRAMLEIVQTKLALRGRSAQELGKLPRLTDPLGLQHAGLLQAIVAPALTAGYKLVVAVCLCRMVRFGLKYGVTSRFANGFAGVGSMLQIYLRDYEAAEVLGEASLEIARGDPVATCQALIPYVGYAGCWTSMPFARRMTMLSDGYNTGIGAGELVFGSYCAMVISTSGFIGDPSLSNHIQQCDATIAAMDRVGIAQATAIRYVRRRACCVAGTAELPDAQQLGEAMREAEPMTRALGGLAVLDVGLLFDREDLSLFGLAEVDAYGMLARGSLSEIGNLQSTCIWACRAYVTSKHRRPLRARVVNGINKFAAWAKVLPEKFSGFLYRLKGEWALGRGRAAKSLDYFRRALEFHRERPQWRAQILESMVRAQLALGNELQAGMELKECCEAYRAWGAKAKVEQLSRTYASLGPGQVSSLESSSITPNTVTAMLGSRFDLEAVLKSTQALSGEVVLERLLETMVYAILESTGGQRVAVIEHSGDHSRLSAWGEVGEHGISMTLDSHDSAAVPASILASVGRTHEPVVLSDAASTAPWSGDPVVRSEGIRSVLCVPVIRQRQLRAIVYVDHCGVADCFPPVRARLLSMLASQIAISLENARLYGTLEAKVEQRTLALREVTEDLQAILDHVRFGFLVIGSDLKVRKGFSRSCGVLLGKSDLAGRRVSTALGIDNQRLRHEVEFSCEQIFSDMLPEELYQAQFPGRLERGDRVLRVEPSIVRDENGSVTAVLLTITDTTPLELARRQNEVNRTLLGLLRRREAFSLALRDVVALLDEANSAVNRGDTQTVRAGLHTLKGTMGLFGLFEVREFIHELEDKECIDAADIGAVRAAVAGFLKRHHGVLGMELDGHSSSKVTVGAGDLSELENIARGFGGQGETELSRWISRVRSPAVGDILGPVARSAVGLGRELGKQIKCSVEGRRIKVPEPEVQSVMRDLVHLVNNSVSHGIEAPTARGPKAPRGSIELNFSEERGGYTVEVRDDGRGIDLDAVAERAVLAGVVSRQDVAAMSEQQRLELVFAARVSTADSVGVVAGRGVGLSGLKSRVDAIGGTIRVESKSGVGTTFVLSLPRCRSAGCEVA